MPCAVSVLVFIKIFNHPAAPRPPHAQIQIEVIQTKTGHTHTPSQQTQTDAVHALLAPPRPQGSQRVRYNRHTMGATVRCTRQPNKRRYGCRSRTNANLPIHTRICETGDAIKS